MLQEYVTVHPGVFFKHVKKSAKMEKIYINFFKFSSVNFWDFIFFLKQIIEDMISEYRIFCHVKVIAKKQKLARSSWKLPDIRYDLLFIF